MSAADDDTEKSHEPTDKKLQDARDKGEVARSTDVSTAAAYGGVLVFGAAWGAQSLQAAGNILTNFFDQAATIDLELFAGTGQPQIGMLFFNFSLAVVAFFVLPGVFVIVSVIAQRAFVVAPSKLKPKLSRISLIANAKNKFGRNGLFEFAKSFTKLTIYSIVLAIYLRNRLDQMAGTVDSDPAIAVSIMMRMCLEFTSIVLVIAMAIATIDYAWQYFEHRRKNRMSRKEITDEVKQSEGDPHMKQQRRQKGQQIAMNKMLKDVPDADVIIVNPTHYAVALKWSRKKGDAPECVAKGVDEMAGRIREIAQEAGVPIHRDPPTARALHASVEIGQQISEEHYRPVAAAIRFAEAMRSKARNRGW